MGSTSKTSPLKGIQSKLNARLLVFYMLVVVLVPSLHAQNEDGRLSPASFNLAENRMVYATSTCGDGVDKEEYCILGKTSRETGVDGVVRSIQMCDYCDSRDTRKAHPARNVLENNHKYWQSPPLSRSTKYHAVNLTIDLGQDFNVGYVFIEMGISPRPGVWALERSVDNGKTFQPWQYFASDESECKKFFGPSVEFSVTRDDSVICETQYSKVLPLQNGEIYVPIIRGRPSENNFAVSASLQKWSRATNIRLHLMRTKTLSADVVSVERQDPTVTRRYFYSIRYIDVGGRCVCNGHASRCNPTKDGKLSCSCVHNTAGDKCEECAGLYNQKAWKPATIDNPNVCERCNCFEHANSCVYNKTIERMGLSLNEKNEYRGGGVCKDCLHNTAGINCEKCRPGYYQQRGKILQDLDICEKCPCEFEGLDKLRYSGECHDLTAKCKCNVMYMEPNCDQCSEGHYGFPKCKPCDCFQNGTLNGLCENQGQACPCKSNFGGFDCRECAPGFYKHPECQACQCNQQNSQPGSFCNPKTGKCVCKSGFGGRICDEYEVGYFG